jgi:hypothetical protein
MLFLVTVRVNVARMAEFGQKLERGELDRSAMRHTYCLEKDPAVGMGVWEAADQTELEGRLGPWRPYYETVDVQPLITPAEARTLLS